MDPIIGAAVTTAATLISGILLFCIKRLFYRQQEATMHRENAKAKENELILRSLNALGKLTVANSVALRDGHTNGEMSAALSEYESVERELYSYIISAYTDRVS